MAEIEPEFVKETKKQVLNEFFDQLRFIVKQTQETVKERIQNSTKLKELETILEQNKDVFDNNQGEGFIMHKEKFD